MKRPDAPTPLRELAVERGWIAAIDADLLSESPNSPALRDIKAYLLASDDRVSPDSWSQEVLGGRARLAWDAPPALCDEAAHRGWLAALSDAHRFCRGDGAPTEAERALKDLHQFMATSHLDAGSMPLLLGRWETRGQKHWYELVEERHPTIGVHWSYRGDGCGGGFGGRNDLGWNRELAFAEMVRRVHMAKVIDGINMRLVASPFELPVPELPEEIPVHRLELIPGMTEAREVQRLVSLAEIKGAPGNAVMDLIEARPDLQTAGVAEQPLVDQIRALLQAGVEPKEIQEYIEDSVQAPTWEDLSPRG